MRRIAIAVVVLLASRANAEDLRHFADAPLRAVQFVDENEGWAIGDDGVVWHTPDGGQSWERQPTGVRASLRALHFLDPFTGFIVGSESLPHGHGSTGVILATNDGGLKWHRVSMKSLPGLHQVKFLDRRTGYVAGDGSDQFPTGIFVTDDGGATWKPIPGARGPGWRGLDLVDANNGVLVGPWAQVAPLRRRELATAEVDSLGGRNVRAVQLQGRTAWAVGDGGLVLVSEESAGKRWGHVELRLPPEVGRACDWHAVHFVGDKGWLAGRPGTLVLHTKDRGKTWEKQPTGQPLPLHGLCFVDEKRGWAVGELGTILATTDGGNSWKVQQRGGHRPAVLIVTARTEGTPAATVAILGADEGYLTATVQVTCADPSSSPPGRAAEEARLAEAMRLTGGCGAEMLHHFPLPGHVDGSDSIQLNRALGQSEDQTQALARLEKQLVLALRMWRPSAVITDNPDPRGHTLEVLIAQATQNACRRAADPNAYPEQISGLGLQPWKVDKLYGRWNEPKTAHVTMDIGEPRPQLLASSADFAAPALSLIHDEGVVPPSMEHYRLLESRIADAEKHKHLMQGIALEHGGQARRARMDVNQQRWEVVKAIHQRRDLRAIAKQQMQDPAQAQRLLATVEKSLVGLSEDQAAEAAFALANLCASEGQWPMAKEVFLLMVDRYPAHRLTPDACRWLIKHGSSSEARRREEMRQFMITSTYEFKPRTKGDDEVVQASHTQLLRSRQTALLRRWQDIHAWYKGSLALGDCLAALGAVHFADPEMQFCLQSARRNLGELDEAHLWYTQFKLQQSEGPWSDAAGAELWLNNRQGLPPKAMVQCVQIDTPPYLDGKLDDECWKETKRVKLKDAVGKTGETHATEAWLAYDAEYLYLALRCKHPADGHLPAAKPRPRDPDLARFDRVSLLLDLDRDYATCFHLQVDQRGWAAEDCWGDKSWNPKWHVAVHSDATSWQIEAAIPMAELTGDPVSFGTTWACNIVRTIPGKGVQGISLPADAAPRLEGLGLLGFVQSEQARPAVKPVKPGK